MCRLQGPEDVSLLERCSLQALEPEVVSANLLEYGVVLCFMK